MTETPFHDLSDPELESVNTLQALFNQDQSPLKANLMCGVYRTDEGKAFVLPAVKQARELLYNDPLWDHEYPPSHIGTQHFRDLTSRLILGGESSYTKDKCIVTIQTLGGSGACHMGAVFLDRHYSPWKKGAPKRVYIPKETWTNHPNVFRYLNIAVSNLPYYSPESGAVAFSELKDALNQIPNQSVVVLQVAANNPTGCDLSQEQWNSLVDDFRRKGHFAFFDAAYLGFASGDYDRDSAPLRLFVEKGIPMLCATSYGKTFGIYGERIGSLSIPLPTADLAKKTEKHMKLLARAETGAMPVFGSKLVESILGCANLAKEWKSNLQTMAAELKRRRLHLRTLLEELDTPRDWSFLTTQAGMFSYTGLSSGQIDMLRESFHVYLQDTGRLSIAGLTKSNISHVARSIDAVVRHSQFSESTIPK
ncbi:aspartate aminotransferase, cytoplasmic isozyme 1 [Aspergillus lentulus]|uniref:Aspartate aminotransferase n=1 Tax=Aspergillus lentulus TaxID=293939 RepID=A0AAN4TE92_ASPLE|nr:aspartate aminotransferase, cytoplasmic isozyme 1 [Aspergillus lentulus]